MTTERDAPEIVAPPIDTAAWARLLPPPVPPAGIPTTDHRPQTSPQYARRQALQLAISHHRATDEEFTRTDVLETAAAFANYIRTGTVPGVGQNG